MLEKCEKVIKHVLNLFYQVFLFCMMSICAIPAKPVENTNNYMQHPRKIQSQNQVNNVILNYIIKMCSICSHFKHSVLAKQRLHIIQNSLNMDENNLIQSVLTCWNSILHIIKIIIERKKRWPCMLLTVAAQKILRHVHTKCVCAFTLFKKNKNQLFSTEPRCSYFFQHLSLILFLFCSYFKPIKCNM